MSCDPNMTHTSSSSTQADPPPLPFINLTDQAFTKILQSYCRAVQESNPSDIISFSANYFENMRQQRAGDEDAVPARKELSVSTPPTGMQSKSTSSTDLSEIVKSPRDESPTEKLSKRILNRSPSKAVVLLQKELNTDLSIPPEKLLDLVTSFKEYSKDGSLDRKSFEKIFQQIDNNSYQRLRPIFSRIFDAFDADKNQSLDFVELITGLSRLLHGTLEQKIDLLLHMIDYNHDNNLELREVLSFFKKWYQAKCAMAGYKMSAQQWTNLQRYLVKSFNASDVDHNGVLDRDEFEKIAKDPDSPISMLVMALDEISPGGAQ